MDVREKLRTLAGQLTELEGKIKNAAIEFENTVEDSAGVQDLMYALAKLGEARETLQDRFASQPEETRRERILRHIRELTDANKGRGADWSDILEKARPLSDDAVEEELNALMDEGIIYEPVLGRLKIITRLSISGGEK